MEVETENSCGEYGFGIGFGVISIGISPKKAQYFVDGV